MQERGDIVVPVDDGNHQRAQALGIEEIHVRPCGEQRSRRRHRTLPGCEHQRREAAARERGIERLQGETGDPIPLRLRRQDRGAGVHACPALDEHLHDRIMVLGGRHHQRGLPEPSVSGVGIRAACKQ